MIAGQCYLYVGGSHWVTADCGKFYAVQYTPDGLEVLIGRRKVHHARCNIFRCSDGRLRAQRS